MIFVADKTRKTEEKITRLRIDAVSILGDSYSSYCDIINGNIFPVVIQDHSKNSRMTLFKSSDEFGAVEIFDETDGGFW